jgi:hypothetical protein
MRNVKWLWGDVGDGPPGRGRTPTATHYWHVTGLANGKHTLRIVVRSDADARSKGQRVELERAIVLGPRPQEP